MSYFYDALCNSNFSHFQYWYYYDFFFPFLLVFVHLHVRSMKYQKEIGIMQFLHLILVYSSLHVIGPGQVWLADWWSIFSPWPIQTLNQMVLA